MESTNGPEYRQWLLDVTFIGEKQQENAVARPEHGPSITPDDNHSHFAHEPITSSNTIRIFHLSPGSFEDPIRGSFTEFELKDTIVRGWMEPDFDDGVDFTLEHLWPPANASADEDASKPDYLAISYTWLSDDAKLNVVGEAVELNDGSRIPITYNLSRCLRRIRRKTQVQRLWIDQLCINQGPSGIRDKEQQIPLMGKIYSQARGVLLWVGEHIDNVDTAAAFDLIHRLHFATQNVPSPRLEAWAWLRACSLSTIQHMFRLPPRDSSAWKHYYKFIRRRVFTRLWILQEVCLARCVGVLCGDYLIDFRMLGESQDFLAYSGLHRMLGIRYEELDDLNDWMPTKGHLCIFSLWRRRFNSVIGVEQSLTFLLMESSVFKTDRDFPQDRIYALLGLVVQELEDDVSFPASLSPDYSKPYERVAQDAVECLLMRQTEDFLDILSLAVYDPRPSEHFGPSWVPSFSTTRSFTLTFKGGGAAKRRTNNHGPASSRSSTACSKPPEILDNSLILDGWMVDRIVVACPLDLDLDMIPQPYEDWLDRIATAVDSFSFLGAPYAAGDNVDPVDALWRTIIRDWAANDEEDGVASFRKRFFCLVVQYCIGSVWAATKNRIGAKYGIHPDVFDDLEVIRMAASSQAIESELRLLLCGSTSPDDINDEQNIVIRLSGLTGPFAVSGPAIKAARPGLWKLLYEHIFPRFGKVTPGEQDWVIPFRHMMDQCARGYSFFATEKGLFGLGPLSVQEGDEVYVLRGGKMPFVLRDKGTQGESGHVLIGESYVHGIMHGEECEREGFAGDRVIII